MAAGIMSSFSNCTGMQENTWVRLRDMRPGTPVIHATLSLIHDLAKIIGEMMMLS